MTASSENVRKRIEESDEIRERIEEIIQAARIPPEDHRVEVMSIQTLLLAEIAVDLALIADHLSAPDQPGEEE